MGIFKRVARLRVMRSGGCVNYRIHCALMTLGGGIGIQNLLLRVYASRPPGTVDRYSMITDSGVLERSPAEFSERFWVLPNGHQEPGEPLQEEA